MAERKKKAAVKAVPSELSDQEIVLNKFESAEIKPVKSGFAVFSGDFPVHSGIAKSEGDAWKLAARACL